MTDRYEVGYGRPPKASQFRKGQSGNPLGSSRKARKRKPRQNRSFDDLVLENGKRPLRIREGNRTSEISTKEALIKKQTALALGGSRLALEACLKRIEHAEKNKLAEVLDRYETVLDYKRDYPALVKSKRKLGLPPPLPHPDDIQLNLDTGELRFTGPLSIEELATLRAILEARRAFTAKLDEHRLDEKESADQGCPYSASDFKIISLIEEHLASFEHELDKRGWLPRIAGAKE